jgi:hypothetical protein
MFCFFGSGQRREARLMTFSVISDHPSGHPSAMWVDKYRPTTLDRLEFHKDVTEKLRKLVRITVSWL